MKLQTWIAVAIMLVMAGGSLGCKEDTAAEKMARQLEEAAEDAADAIGDAAEDAADAIDDAADEAKKKLQ